MKWVSLDEYLSLYFNELPLNSFCVSNEHCADVAITWVSPIILHSTDYMRRILSIIRKNYSSLEFSSFATLILLPVNFINALLEMENSLLFIITLHYNFFRTSFKLKLHFIFQTKTKIFYIVWLKIPSLAEN